MHVTCVQTLNALVGLTDALNALAGGMPFRRMEWYATWWCHYGELGRLFVICVRDGSGELIAAAPWYLGHHPAKGRVVRFLASDEVCSDYQTILCRPGYEDEATAAIAGWLSQTQSVWYPRSTNSRRAVGVSPPIPRQHQPCDPWDLLEFTGIESADVPMQRLAAHLKAHGNQVHREPALNCWRLELPETWDDYLARLSKSHRKQVRRLDRRVLDTGRGVWHTVTHEDQLPAAFDTLIDLHQRRWQGRGADGVFSSSRFTAFHRDVAQQLFDLGQLRLQWLELDGQPAAAEYDFAGDGVVYAYQSGLNPGLLDEDPGSLCNLALLRGAMADGYAAVDFLRGDEPYKAHWRAEPRACHDLRVVPWRLTARLRHTAWTAGKRVKSWLSEGAGKRASR